MADKTTAPPASTSQTKDPAIVERTDLQIKGARKKKGIQPAHPSSLGSHHFFVATAATRWMAPNVHHAAGPPSGDGVYGDSATISS